MEKHLSKSCPRGPRVYRIIQTWEQFRENLYEFLNFDRDKDLYASTRRKLYKMRDEMKEAYLACNQLLGEPEDTEPVDAHINARVSAESSTAASQEIIERTTTTTERIVRNTANHTDSITASATTIDRKEYLLAQKEFIYAIAKKPSEYACINELTDLLRRWFVARFIHKWDNFKRYTYSPNQIPGFIQQFVARYAYDVCCGTTAEFTKQLEYWISQMDKDEEITSKSSMPAYIYMFDAAKKKNKITMVFIYVWWAFIYHIRSEKYKLKEYRDDFDIYYIDNIAKNIAPELYRNCDKDNISIFLE